MKFLKAFLIVFLITICDSGSLPCKDCALRKTAPVEELRQLRFEYLKKRILKKLHLTEPPKIQSPKPSFSSSLVIAELTKNNTVLEVDDQPEIENTVINSRNGNLPCSKHTPSLCNRFEFAIPENLLLGNFISAEVWINKESDKLYRAYQVIKSNRQNTLSTHELSNPVIEKTSSPWNKYSVFRDTIKSNNSSENVIVIEVVHGRENLPQANFVIKDEEKPFVVVRSEADTAKRSSRKKRSEICDGNNPYCCRENFYLDFSEIGWDTWILHPPGYNANFCRGRCFSDFSNTRFYHSTILLNYFQGNEDLAQEIGISVCCTPSVMKPITIFYRNEDQLIYQKRIENMIVEACDCA